MSNTQETCFLLVAKRAGESDTSLLIFEAIEDAQAQAQYLLSEQNYAQDELRLLQTVIHKRTNVGSADNVPDETVSRT
jgi:hypothetical protein